MHKSAGFTLIELSVTVALAGIVLALGMPSMQALITKVNLEADSQELASALRLARQSAIELNASTKVCALKARSDVLEVATCNGSNWGNGWGVFRDDGGTWKLLSEFPPLENVILETRDTASNAITQSEVTFSAIGTLSAASEITVFYFKNADDSCAVTTSITTLAGLVETSDASCT